MSAGSKSPFRVLMHTLTFPTVVHAPRLMTTCSPLSSDTDPLERLLSVTRYDVCALSALECDTRLNCAKFVSVVLFERLMKSDDARDGRPFAKNVSNSAHIRTCGTVDADAPANTRPVITVIQGVVKWYEDEMTYDNPVSSSTRSRFVVTRYSHSRIRCRGCLSIDVRDRR